MAWVLVMRFRSVGVREHERGSDFAVGCVCAAAVGTGRGTSERISHWDWETL